MIEKWAYLDWPPMTFGEAMILTGGILEIVGVGLVAFEIARDIREAAKVRPTAHTVFLGPARMHGSAEVLAAGTGGRAPSLEERVAALEQAQTDDRKSVGERIDSLQERLENEMGRRYTQLQQETQDLREWFGSFLGGLLTGGIAVRIIGISLAIIGVGLNVAGSLIAN